MSGRELVVGIDLGGTRFRAAVAGSAPRDVEPMRQLVDTDAPASLDELAGALQRCRDEAGQHGEVARMALAVPGLVDGTVCTWIPNLPYLDGVDVGELVDGSVVAGNDAQMSLLAEAVGGSATDVDDAVLLAIGTGIGSAVMAGRRIVRGAGGGACSFGWACADLDDAGDDTLGWLERQASGTALDERAATLGLDRGSSLVAAARSDDPDARRAVDDAAMALGTTLSGAVALLDPRLVVIVGGVAGALDVIRQPLRTAMERQLPRHLRDVALATGTFGANAGLQGAVIAARLGPTWWEIPR